MTNAEQMRDYAETLKHVDPAALPMHQRRAVEFFVQAQQAGALTIDPAYQLEPTGPYAVALDRDGDAWVRYASTGEWHLAARHVARRLAWRRLCVEYGPMTVIFEGVEPE